MDQDGRHGRGTTCAQVFAHRLRKYLGAYLLQLADLDDVVIVFSGGIGENSSLIRRMALQNLDVRSGFAHLQHIKSSAAEWTRLYVRRLHVPIMPQCMDDSVSSIAQRWGIAIDEDNNDEAVGVDADISAEGSRVKVLVLKTDEELAIAQQTLEVVNA